MTEQTTSTKKILEGFNKLDSQKKKDTLVKYLETFNHLEKIETSAETFGQTAELLKKIPVVPEDLMNDMMQDVMKLYDALTEIDKTSATDSIRNNMKKLQEAEENLHKKDSSDADNLLNSI